MNIVDLLNKYGAPSSIKVGDNVLVEGFNKYGIFIIQCEVINLTKDTAEVKEIEKYYISGNSLRSSNEIKTYQIEELKRPIKDRLIEQNEFVQWLVNNINN